MVEEYENFANAIIRCAVKDYQRALKGMNKTRSKNRKTRYETELKTIEKFFRSRWFKQLTDIDPEFLIRKIKEEQGG